MNQQIKRSRHGIAGMILGLCIIILPVLSNAQEERLEERLQVPTEPPKEERVVPLQKVAVLPFLLVLPDVPGQRMVKGLYGVYFFRTGDLPARARNDVSSAFQLELDRLGRCELISSDQAWAAVEGIDAAAFRKDPLGMAAQIGQELGVYAVVIGGVYHYEQRQGSALGVQSPASAAFDAHLIQVADKKVLWSGRFDETQHSLMENLLKIDSFVKGGAQWVTVERWSEIGIEKMLRTFPTLNR
jgi:hypothetical protein